MKELKVIEGLKQKPHWYTQIDGIVYHGQRIYVPKEGKLRKELIKTFHDSPIAGHMGLNATTLAM